jgi:hypothetical protein
MTSPLLGLHAHREPDARAVDLLNLLPPSHEEGRWRDGCAFFGHSPPALRPRDPSVEEGGGMKTADEIDCFPILSTIPR